MKYDPNNELTEEEMEALSEEEFFEYLDTKAEYLKGFTKPLGEYHTKRYASLTASHLNRPMTDAEYKSAKRIGKEGDKENQQKIVDKMMEKGWEEPDKRVKNVKTHRSQWFE